MDEDEQDDLGGFDLLPAGTEAPEGDLALALQAEAADDTGVVLDAEIPAPLGRTYAYDFVRRRFLPVGASLPVSIDGVAAQRQTIEKVLRTYRGASAVCGPDFGIDLDDDVIDGGAFDAGAFAEYEAACHEAIEALPWVLEVSDFVIDHDPDDDAVFVSFVVIAEGTVPDDQSVLAFDQLSVADTR